MKHRSKAAIRTNTGFREHALLRMSGVPHCSSPAGMPSKGIVTETVIGGAKRRRNVGLLPQATSSPRCTVSVAGYAILRCQEWIPTEQGSTLLAWE